MIYRKYGKRVFDIVAATVGGVLLSPVFLLVALWISLSTRGPVLYAQKRVGKGFKPFYLYKFRSMVPNAERVGPGVTSREDPRITKVGKFIRRTKIDELPQLYNVLKGEMSLVGPRPELPKFVEAKRDDYVKVLSVKPGITDSAAIAFRDEESLLMKYEDKEKAYIEIILPQKIELYRDYIDTISFLKDLKLIFATFKEI